MTEPNELTLRLKGATISQLTNGGDELTVIFKNVQGGEISFNGASHILDRTITAAPNIITDSKTATALPRLHHDGQYVSGKGTYLHTIKPPEKFGYRLPEAYLWIAPDNVKAGTYAKIKRQLARSRDGNNYGRENIPLRDRPIHAPLKPYEYAAYEHWAACAAGQATPGYVLPPIEILAGCSADGDASVIENNLYDMHRKNILSDKFTTNSGRKIDSQYFSCTEAPGDSERILVMDFREPGSIVAVSKNSAPRSARTICLTFAP
ncbi:MAG TPA: hypothetical protein PKX38_05055 [Alphaproteobacteria bacterium]|nr:hypothetical protein [Micavibrio sp.]MBK9562352.1 hypothetical protein [Micavibrio sp.]HQX27289.1 hypothetical protein [Alphaproteobacteria bacterium]